MIPLSFCISEVAMFMNRMTAHFRKNFYISGSFRQ